ncbi:MAG: hypothetical protein AB7T38_03435 [Nitrospirales bacterium]
MSLLTTIGWKIFLCAILLTGSLTACGQEANPFQEENTQLKKQVAKLETVIHSLQEGNKVMQQQIDLLNHEARKIAEEYEAKLLQARTEHESKLKETQGKVNQLTNAPKEHAAKILALEQENQKLAGETKWLRNQRDQMRKSLTIQQIGGQTQELPFGFTAVSKIIGDTLTKNGYSILSSMETDQKAVFITDKKTTLPPSLELSGFRNQYMVMVEKGPADHTILWVRAEFEKISKNGNIFSAPPTESADIELRLIQEIHQSLATGMGTQARNS